MLVISHILLDELTFQCRRVDARVCLLAMHRREACATADVVALLERAVGAALHVPRIGAGVAPFTHCQRSLCGLPGRLLGHVHGAGQKWDTRHFAENHPHCD